MLIINRIVSILVIMVAANYLVQAQISQTTSAKDNEALAKQLFTVSSNDERQRLFEANQDKLNLEFYQILVELAVKGNDQQRSLETLRFAADFVRNRKKSGALLEISIGIGKLHISNDQYDEARGVFESVREILPTVDTLSSGIALATIGDIYLKKGRYKESLSWFSEAEAVFKPIQNQEAMNWLAKSLTGMAACYSETSNYDKALEALDKSEKLYTKTNNKLGLASVMNEYGVLFDFLQNKTRAEQSYLNALSLIESSGTEKAKEQIPSIKVNLGLLQTISLGEYDKALKNFDDAEPFLKDEFGLAVLYGNKSIALRRIGRLEEGVIFAKRSLDLFSKIFKDDPDPYYIANSYSEYANALLDSKRYSESLKNAEEAISRAGTIREIKWIALTTKGQALVGLNRFPEAKEEFNKAIYIVEDLADEAFGDEESRAVYFGGFIYPYHFMADLLLRQGDYENALLYAERSKAKGILGSLQGIRNDWSQGMTEVQKQQERELVKKLVLINTDLGKEKLASKIDPLLKQREELRRQLETFRLRLYKSNPEVSSRRIDISLT